MTNSNCFCRYNCLDLAILVSVIVGVIAAILTFGAVIVVTPAFLWVLFGIAVAYLAIILYRTLGKNTVCEYANSALNAVFVGILGTILTAVILLGISFAATSIVGAIVVGLLLFFFSLTITATVCLIRRLLKCEQ